MRQLLGKAGDGRLRMTSLADFLGLAPFLVFVIRKDTPWMGCNTYPP